MVDQVPAGSEAAFNALRDCGTICAPTGQRADYLRLCTVGLADFKTDRLLGRWMDVFSLTERGRNIARERT